MLGWRHSAIFIALPRDHSQATNHVSIDHQGHPVLHYDFVPADRELMMKGLEANLRFMRAAGAKFLYIPLENFPWFYCGGPVEPTGSNAISNTEYNTLRSVHSTSSNDATHTANILPFNPSIQDDERFEAYLKEVRRRGIETAKMPVFSAHQMSSCRMASSPDTGPTSPSGELYECSNLFVADGSVLPTSLGINPMLTIEACAHMISKNVIKRLCDEHGDLKNRVNRFTVSQQW